MEARKIPAVMESKEVIKMVEVLETVSEVVEPERYEVVFQNKEALQFLAGLAGNTSERTRTHDFGLSFDASKEIADFYFRTVALGGIIEKGDNDSAKITKRCGC